MPLANGCMIGIHTFLFVNANVWRSVLPIWPLRAVCGRSEVMSLQLAKSVAKMANLEAVRAIIRKRRVSKRTICRLADRAVGKV